MLTNNAGFYGAKIIADIFKDILYFPFWWYSRGLLNFIGKNLTFLNYRQKSLGLLVWIKNLFKPMYGQHDWQGRLISFGFRVVFIIFDSVVMVFYVLLSLIAVLFWIIFPFFVLYEILYQLYPGIDLLFIG